MTDRHRRAPLSVRLPLDLEEGLQEIQERTGTSRHRIVVNAVRWYIKYVHWQWKYKTP